MTFLRNAFNHAVLFLLAVSAGLAAAQQAQAPEGLEKALVERVKFFYQAHVDGKFRVADKVVAEDSKDAFFEAEKRRYDAFEIVKVAFEDNFSRARVLVSCDAEMQMPGFPTSKAKVPVQSLWKLENGEWFWHVAPVPAVDSPFGSMTPGQGGSASFISAGPRSFSDLSQLAKLDREQITFQPQQLGREEVVITHSLPGELELKLEAVSHPALKVALDTTNLKPGAAARLSVHHHPVEKPAPREVEVLVRVLPIETVLRLRVVIAAAAPAAP